MSTLTLPPSMSNRLDAVNVLLQAIGESPVNSVDTSEAVDVASASQCLDEFDLAVQTQGWPWNREYSVSLLPTSDGSIYLPQNCIAMVRAYPKGATDRIVERGRRLYNQAQQTYTFTAAVSVDMILRLEWEELPEVVRRYITIWAAQQYQGRVQTSAGVEAILSETVAQARAACGHAEDEAEGANCISGNASVAYRVNGRLRRRPN